MVVIEEERQRAEEPLRPWRFPKAVAGACIRRTLPVRQKEAITKGFRPPVIVDYQLEKRRRRYARVKPLFFMALSKPFRQLRIVD
ncbi:hypothetical protein CEN39_17465 [Fischerella thermalis CCMEE 5201]|jgi:hypothetical protein|nr:hypothetical protein CEN39_17465 [Fischerella thermalis CCMEE 5201]